METKHNIWKVQTHFNDPEYGVELYEMQNKHVFGAGHSAETVCAERTDVSF
jgi:hypothetical protein